MNIELKDFKALRCLLSKKDKEDLAKQSGCSFSLVMSILLGFRKNDEVEKNFLIMARGKLEKLILILEAVEEKNNLTKNRY